jgi:hypothetical protein
MPDRQALIPIIWCQESDLDATFRLLDKWKDKIADTMIVFPESIPIIETLLARTGRPIIPVVRVTAWLKSMADFRPDSAQAEWIAYLKENMEHFECVQIGNCQEEVHAETPADGARIVREIAAMFPDFDVSGRLAMAPWHTDIEADAGTADAPLRHALAENCDQLVVYCGCSLADTPRMSAWLRGLNAWSGIGYATGAEQHGLRRLIATGFEAAVFFLPIRTYDYDTAIHAFEREPLSAEEADALMQRYTTDIES